MKELNLLFPTIPNLSIFIWENSWNNRFENTWWIYWTNMNHLSKCGSSHDIWSFQGQSHVLFRLQDILYHYHSKPFQNIFCFLMVPFRQNFERHIVNILISVEFKITKFSGKKLRKFILDFAEFFIWLSICYFS